MWSKIDDALLDHPKIYLAGRELGKDGPAIALGVYLGCLLWSNKQLTDGYIPAEVLARFPLVDKPLIVADALIRAGLLEKVLGGYQIHDFKDYNKSAADIKKHRQEDRARKLASA